MIQKITSVEELPADFEKLATDFFAYAKMPGHFDYAFFRIVWKALFDAKTAVIWVSQKKGKTTGIFGAIISPCAFSGMKILAESFWYTSDDAGMLDGIALFSHFESYAEHIQANKIIMTHLFGSVPEKMRKFLYRKQYTPIEANWVKMIWQ
jgi:hypothetical protein